MNQPAITLIDTFIEKPYELFVRLAKNIEWDERMKARKTASFGVSYDYSGITYPPIAMLTELNPICEKIQSEFGFLPNNCLMNYYPDGNASMGYHADSVKDLEAGTGVAILSLGEQRTIHFKSNDDKNLVFKYLLMSGTLLYMDDKIQQQWLHAIPKEPDVGGRISLTFRRIIQ